MYLQHKLYVDYGTFNFKLDWSCYQALPRLTSQRDEIYFRSIYKMGFKYLQNLIKLSIDEDEILNELQ